MGNQLHQQYRPIGSQKRALLYGVEHSTNQTKSQQKSIFSTAAEILATSVHSFLFSEKFITLPSWAHEHISRDCANILLTHLLRAKNCDNWECNEASNASRWSSCSFKQVSTSDRNGWWWMRGAGEAAGLFCCCCICWCWCCGVPLLLLRLFVAAPLGVIDEFELLLDTFIFSRTWPIRKPNQRNCTFRCFLRIFSPMPKEIRTRHF